MGGGAAKERECRKDGIDLLGLLDNARDGLGMSNSAQYSRDISAILFDGDYKMLWTIIVILGILWLLGFSFHVGGALIHILLVIAVVVLIFNLLAGRRSV